MNKKYLIVGILALIFIFIFILFNNKKVEYKNYPPKSSKIIAFGDSLVSGYGSTPGNDFVSQLSGRLQKPIINMGVPGNTTSDGLGRLQDVIDNDPGTVMLLLGGNDYLRKVPDDIIFKNLKEIIGKLQDKGIFVILLGIRGGVLSDRFKDKFSRLADEMNVLYVPNVLENIIDNKEYMSDAIHPNDLGYKIIEEKIYNKMKIVF